MPDMTAMFCPCSPARSGLVTGTFFTSAKLPTKAGQAGSNNLDGRHVHKAYKHEKALCSNGHNLASIHGAW
eukprot:1160127-Pelagomonas_calceolata.AAC.1